MEILVGIASSIAATAIVAMLTLSYRRGVLQEWWDNALALITPRSVIFRSESQRSYAQVRRHLLRRLRKDQSRRGIHFGQFGLGADVTEEAKYQTGHEEMSVKPRMYLTIWPARVLAERQLSLRALALATKGVERLFINNRIHVYQSVINQTLPQRQPSIISYRHTMSGALFLNLVQGCSNTVRNVLDAMIDNRNGWQNDDGGWSQCDTEHTASDLLGSAYAANLLHFALSENNAFSDPARTLMESSLARTLQYLKSCWETNAWAYGGASSEEVAVLMLAEIAPVLRLRERSLLKMTVNRVYDWLSPSLRLSETYRACCGEVSIAALCTRASFALCSAGEDIAVWGELFWQAIRNIDQDLNSTEMAFLLDLTYQVEERRKMDE